ncbi:uncharacterized protein N7479_001263 [Penicillium vulpinum]|uniref:uncharacterized protein n=1 Tax=Penicillium vulpinum TaxID=29845 RepID=UPI0025473FA3|nr:uncharacterized protein N7479_001263 [Penicillium vulpinum]KAJ5971345.1 hypothetical protein N7479_001263 [Penicillium vulpinum]
MKTGGFTALGLTPSREDPKISIWETRASEGKDGKHVQQSGGVLAAAAAALPIDRKVEGKCESSASGRRVLSRTSENAKALLASDLATDTEKNGLNDKEVNAGLYIACYLQDDEGLVVSFSGSHHKPRMFQRFRSKVGFIQRLSYAIVLLPVHQPGWPLKQSTANNSLHGGDELIDELYFEVERIVVSNGDIEQGEKTEKKEEKVWVELEAKKIEIMRNTMTRELVPHLLS